MVDTQAFIARVRDVVERMAAERRRSMLAEGWVAFIEIHPSFANGCSRQAPAGFMPDDQAEIVATLYLDCTQYDPADTAITITMIDGGDQS